MLQNEKPIAILMKCVAEGERGGGNVNGICVQCMINIKSYPIW